MIDYENYHKRMKDDDPWEALAGALILAVMLYWVWDVLFVLFG